MESPGIKELKVSIIVPVYNTEDFFQKCIDSIVHQSHKNIEIILVDDGSTDNSLQLCTDIQKKDSRIVVINQKNRGVSAARNRGIECASGEYIGFVDSDDFITVDMYEKLLKAAYTYNADIAECGVTILDTVNKNQRSTNFHDQLISGNHDCCSQIVRKANTAYYTCNKIYRRSILERLRFPPFKYSEDYYVNCLAALQCERKVTIRDHCYFYVYHQNNTTRKPFTIDRYDIIKSGKAVLDVYKSNHNDLSAYIVVYILNNIRVMYGQLKEADMKKTEFKKRKKELILEYEEMYSLYKKDISHATGSRREFIVINLFHFMRFLYDCIEVLAMAGFHKVKKFLQ